MNATTLRLLFVQAAAMAGAALFCGCGSPETCTTRPVDHDIEVPPADGIWSDPLDGGGRTLGTMHADAGSVASWTALGCNEACLRLNPSYTLSCAEVTQHADGKSYLRCTTGTDTCTGGPLVRLPTGGGRRPSGFAPHVRASALVGDFFAAMTELEEASVPAFRFLKRDLMDLKAPRRLVHAASRAARDEIRHTRAMTALARRHGARANRAVVASRKPAHLEIMALQNAVEGCVHETYGALTATWAAQHARDPEVRAIFKRIARDETEHASLAWKIAAWAESRMDRAMRTRVRAARAAAVRRLALSVATSPPRALVDNGLLPAAAEASALVASLGGSLWA